MTDSTSTIRRASVIVPGYDCVTSPCGKSGCGSIPKYTHGAHGDEWIYSVSDGEVALVLMVYSGVTPRRRVACPEGRSLRSHLTFPTEIERLRTGPPYCDDERCEFLCGRPCILGEPRYNAARSFFQKRGAPEYVQPESFWEALEEEFAREAAKARAARVDLTHRQCPCCKGVGTVAIEASDG